MSHLPPDPNDPLVAFLQTYQPPVPEPKQAEVLEAKVMAAIQPQPARQPFTLRHKRLAIAALLGLAGMSVAVVGQLLAPPTPTAQQLAHLEQFLESSWDNSSTDYDSELWLSEP